MATVNLGAIKFNWKGAFNNSTAYAVDDVVSSGGSSYVCILASTGNAVSNGTYWQIMAQAGTNGTNGSNGTDIGTVITTQGDILYRDGSGLQRLAKGTAGKALVMNSAANAPEWGTVAGGKVLQVVNGIKSDTASWTGTQLRTDTGLQAAITPSATSSKILITGLINIGWQNSAGQFFIHLDRGGTEIGQGDAATNRKRAHAQSLGYAAIHAEYQTSTLPVSFVDSPNTTSATTYKVQHSYTSAGDTMYINRSHRDGSYTGYDGRFISSITLMEIGA